MFFKIVAKNPYRDLVRNARKVIVSDSDPKDKVNALNSLNILLKDKLRENERFLNAHPAFAKRCQHWNERSIKSIRPVNNKANPWLAFKQEFEAAVSRSDNASYDDTISDISKALGWFYNHNYRDDWLAA